MTTKSVLFLFVIAGGACSNNSSATSDLGTGSDMAVAAPDLSAAPDLAPPALSVRAQRGLTLSPVTIDTSNMTYDQKEKVGTGAYMVAMIGCGRCHDATPATFLGGGQAFGAAPNQVYARNLTSDPTTGMKLTEAQFIEAMRTGRDFSDANNYALVNMPSTTYRWMTNYDLQSIYAYLKAIPVVNKAAGTDSKATMVAPTASPTAYADGTMSRNLPADDAQDPLGELRGQALQVLDDPPNFATFDDAAKRQFGRGAYLVTLIGCTSCHTNPATSAGKINTNMFLSGGHVYPTAAAMQATLGTVRVMSANLTGQTHGLTMTQAQFVATLTTHKHADETAMRTLGSPMPDYKNLVDDDMIALYKYLTSVPRRTAANDKAVQDYARYCTADAMCNTAAGETCNMTNKECVGKACTTDANCDACQTCTAVVNTCAIPLTTSACLTSGI